VECLRQFSAVPQFFSDRDPASRAFAFSEEDAAIWSSKGTDEIGKTLFLSLRSSGMAYDLVVTWVDRTHATVSRRGDYNVLYGRMSALEATSVTGIWRCLCTAMNAFHGWLDTPESYNQRAHRLLPNGRVQKTIGSYYSFLPGFFAHNYFGPPYVARPEFAQLAGLAVPENGRLNSGFFVDSPTGPTVGRPRDPYTAQERKIIEAIGPQWFHLPEDTGAPKTALSKAELASFPCD
jgi:hypothetical protein